MKRIVVVLMFAALPFAAQGQDARQAPALVLKDLQGRKVRSSDYRGKVVLINFWATWCPPCRKEIPDLIRMQRQYRGQGLQIIGVTYPPQRLWEVRRFVRRFRVNYPVALGTKRTRRLFTATENLPITVIIDRNGNVRDLIQGILLPEEFEQKIKPLLSDATADSSLFPYLCDLQSADAVLERELDSIASLQPFQQRLVPDVELHRHRGHQAPDVFMIDLN